MKKPLIIGAVFGALIVPLATLGLIFQFVELFGRPLILIPSVIVNSLLDTSTMNGAVSILFMMIVSAMFYALLGMALKRISIAWGTQAGWITAIASYVVLFALEMWG